MREKKVAEVRKGKVRKIFCQVALGRMGYSGIEVARFLGVSTSSVNRLAVSKEEGELRKCLNMFSNLRSLSLCNRSWQEKRDS
jgi:hypothetical protein